MHIDEINSTAQQKLYCDLNRGDLFKTLSKNCALLMKTVRYGVDLVDPTECGYVNLHSGVYAKVDARSSGVTPTTPVIVMQQIDPLRVKF